MSHLYKTNQVAGVGSYLEYYHGVAWNNEKTAAAVYEQVASEINEPVPVTKIAERLISIHRDLAAKGYAGAHEMRKTAYPNSVGTLAQSWASFTMDRRAKQASMIMEGGQNTNRAGESNDQLAQLDQHNRPQGTYLTGMGNTDMRAAGSAIVGKEEPHPKATANTSPTNNSVTEHSKTSFDLHQMLQSAGQTAKSYGGAAGNTLKDVASKGLDAVKGINPREFSPAQMAALGGAGGAALGAGGAGLASDDEDRLRNMLLGGLAGGGVGAGAGYGLGSHLLKNRAMTAAGLGSHSNLPGLPEPSFAMPAGSGVPSGPMPTESFPSSVNASPNIDINTARILGLPLEGRIGTASFNPAAVLKLASDLNLTNDQIVSFLQKMAAEGSLTDSATNTPEDAAKHDQVAELDLKNRPKKKHLVGVGKTELPNKGQVAHVEKQKEQPGAQESSPETVPSKETKSAEDQAFIMIFNKTAEQVLPFLPANLPDQHKIAHIRRMVGYSTDEKIAYIKSLR